MSETSRILIACITTYDMMLNLHHLHRNFLWHRNHPWYTGRQKTVWCKCMNAESDNSQCHITTADTHLKQDLFLTGFVPDELPFQFIRHTTEVTRLTFLDRAAHWTHSSTQFNSLYICNYGWQFYSAATVIIMYSHQLILRTIKESQSKVMGFQELSFIPILAFIFFCILWTNSVCMCF
jgi:hypothetical protein